jgi:hypothetical protein
MEVLQTMVREAAVEATGRPPSQMQASCLHRAPPCCQKDVHVSLCIAHSQK